MKSSKNYLIVVLFLVVIGGGTFAWQQYQELTSLRGGSTLSSSERASLQKRLKDAQDRARELEAQLAVALDNMGGEAGEADLASETPATNRGGRGGRGGDFGGRGGRGNPAAVQALLQNPQVQRLLATQQKAALDARYGALIKNLNLSPEQGDKLKALIADGQAAQQDARAAALAAGIDPRTDRQGFERLLADAQAQSDANIKAVIGEDGFASLQQYNQTFAQRNAVTQLQQQLSFTAPLTSQQAEQLVQVLAATSPQGANADPGGRGAFGGRGGGGGGFGGGGPGGALAGNFGGGGGGRGGFGGGVQISPAAVAQAQTFLAPAQVQALQQMQQTQQTQQQVQQLLQQATGNQGNQRGQRGGGGGGGRRATGTGN